MSGKMRITPRDVRVVKDLALSHAVTRDQLIRLGHFHSITRLNSRFRQLIGNDVVKRLQTPFFGQSIYSIGKAGVEIVGERIASLVRGRAESPRFIQHALTVTEVRLALIKELSAEWRFEQQLWRKLPVGNNREVRPDGLLISTSATFVEVDLGHVSPKKFQEKLYSYRDLAKSNMCAELYGFEQFQLLTLTTGALRARHLRRLTPPDGGYEHRIHTLTEIGATPISSWS